MPETPTPNWGNPIPYESLNQEIDDKLTQRFTFLLLFNLLHTGTSNRAFLDLFLQNCFEYGKEPKKQILNDDQINKKFYDGTMKNVNQLFEMINGDDDLRLLMKSSISEILDLLSNRISLQDIHNRLN